MLRLFCLLGVGGLLLAGPAMHSAYASGDQVEVCLVNQSNTHAVLDSTRIFQFTHFGTGQVFRSTFHTRTTYWFGRFTTVDADALPALMEQGLASWGTPLTESHQQFFETLTENPQFQDSYLPFNGGFSSTDYENTDLVARNTDCYWSTSESHNTFEEIE